MANTTPNPAAGRLSGTIGDLVFARSKNGKVIVRRRPVRKTEDNDMAPVDLDQHRQQLTDEIRKYAAGARAERLHPVRVRHAVECGQALVQLKELLRHGDWDRWVEEHCALSRATANRYMRLASRADRLTPYMSIRESYIAAGVINPRQTDVPRPSRA